MDTRRTDALEIPVLKGGLPLLGHIKELQRDPLRMIDRVRDEVGDIGILDLGVRKLIVVSDPASVERILVDHVKNYTKQTRGYEQLRKMLGNGLVTSEGSFWLRQRRIAQPAFHREKLGAIASIMERDTDDVVNAMPAGSFDFAQLMTKLTMRIIGEALFSVDVSGESDSAGLAVNELVHQAMERTMSLVSFPLSVPTPKNRRFVNAKATLDKLVFTVINERRAGASKPDLLSMLLDVVDEETGERMTDAQLRDEVLTLFAAGHETTSMAASWAMFEIMNNPHVEKRLLAELDGNASADKVMRLPYLDAVLKETFRLHPPVWNVARCAEEEDVLAGYRVPKGHLLFVSQWTVHRHPKLWENATTFDPERFLVDDIERHKYAYFPFLGGPRKCIGDQIAILEAKIILAKLLTTHEFARSKNAPAVVADPAVTLRMKHGLWVNATRRKA